MTGDDKHVECERCGRLFDRTANALGSYAHKTIKRKAESPELRQTVKAGRWCPDCQAVVDHPVPEIKRESKTSPNELLEGIHYYLENGFWIFTEHYHRLRGYCCKRGCRHCPYGVKSKT